MSNPTPRLRVEECWMEGGRLSVEVHPHAVRLRGNAPGLVGLARILLWLAHNGLEADQVVDLAAFEAFGTGEPRLELGAPTT
jgi:hypothetical protein